MTKDLQKLYDREYDMLVENLENILSEFRIVGERLARLELLRKLEKDSS